MRSFSSKTTSFSGFCDSWDVSSTKVCCDSLDSSASCPVDVRRRFGTIELGESSPGERVDVASEMVMRESSPGGEVVGRRADEEVRWLGGGLSRSQQISGNPSG